MSDISDIADICRLNLMEEHIQDSPAVDRDATLKAIDWKRRQIATGLPPAELAPGALQAHVKENTIDGIYPWTEHPRFKAQFAEEDT